MNSTTGTLGNALDRFLSVQDVLILDGGLATALEVMGHDLSDRLWSARLLADDPNAIREVHRRYLDAGADCITTASYQATFEGFAARGLAESRAADLFRLSVRLAQEAREIFWADVRNRQDRLRPLVAASVGPYGAYLANGAEYTGRYDLDEPGLLAFHERRFALLVEAGADLLACETIPARPEGLALARLVERTSGVLAWLSFSCRDGQHLRDGTPFREMVRDLAGRRGIAAVGVNCTAPEHVASLLEEARSVTDLPLVAYPNSGEAWDARGRRWSGTPATRLADASPAWAAAGARLIGGCCRTGFDDIRALRARLLPGR
jgi:homocysteine S-methyltransferase